MGEYFHATTRTHYSKYMQFQNRRSRSRKEGKELKKAEPKDAVLHQLEQTMVRTLLPPEQEDEEESSPSADLVSLSVYLQRSEA